MFKQRIIDCFLQKWYTSKCNSSMLTLYHQVKDRVEYENYLVIVPFDLRCFYQDLEFHRIHKEFKHDVMEIIGYHVMNVFVFTVIYMILMTNCIFY